MGAYHEIRLPDGRRLAFAEAGPEGGRPVIGCHGGLSCRLESGFAASLCEELGVRLITPDRPGIGRSEMQPGRRLSDWPRDVEALLDALAIERAAIFGWSAGGPYALACGRYLAQRISRLATVAGMAPVNRAGEVKRLGFPADRLLFPLCRSLPGIAAFVLTLSRFQSRRMIVGSLLHALRASGEPDLEVLKPTYLPLIVNSYREALRYGGIGTAWDYHVLAGPWGFDLGDVTVPVVVWQGDRDGFVPMEHALRLVRELPRATLAPIAGRGHFLLHTSFRQLLSSLVA